MPISEMAGLLSRRYDPDEPWFPTRQGDYVMLDGGLFGQVLLQTPDVEQLQVMGSTKTWPLADFLALHPRNLSLEGFAIPITLGVDDSHQHDILTAVPALLRAHIEQQIARQPVRGHLKGLIVDFNEAATSSLNLIIVGVFRGETKRRQADLLPLPGTTGQALDEYLRRGARRARAGRCLSIVAPRWAKEQQRQLYGVPSAARLVGHGPKGRLRPSHPADHHP